MTDPMLPLKTADRQVAMLTTLRKAGVLDRHLAIRACEDNPALPSRAVAELFFGASMNVDLREAVSRHLFVSGAFEHGLSAFFTRFVKPGMVFIDAGAHFGYFSMLAASRVGPDGRVISIEPTPSTFDMLQSNVAAYSCVTAIQAAVWKTSGQLDLNDFGPAWSAFNSIAGIRLGPNADVRPLRRYTAEAWSLDDLCKDLGVVPDVIKIDVESAEFEVLQGMDGLLRGARPIVTLEVGDFGHLIKEGVAASRTFLERMAMRNYTLFEPTMDGLRRHAIKTSGGYAYTNLVCVPAEKVPLLRAMRADLPSAGQSQ
jgi:FkbM family methyltransferase